MVVFYFWSWPGLKADSFCCMRQELCKALSDPRRHALTPGCLVNPAFLFAFSPREARAAPSGAVLSGLMSSVGTTRLVGSIYVPQIAGKAVFSGPDDIHLCRTPRCRLKIKLGWVGSENQSSISFCSNPRFPLELILASLKYPSKLD